MAQTKLNRREFLRAVGLIALAETLNACAPQATTIPTASDQQQNSLATRAAPTPAAPGDRTRTATTASSTNTPVASPTDTPQPKVVVDGIGAVTEKEAALFRISQGNYRHAFNLSTDQVLSFTTVTVKNSEGKDVTFAAMVTPEGKQLPALILDTDLKTWRKASLRVLADMKKMALSVPLNQQYFGNAGYEELIAENGNTALMTEDLACFDVFNSFTTDTWRSMLKNWEQVKAQMDRGVVPDGYQYNWAPSKKTVASAVANGMKIIGPPLLWPNDVLDSIYQGNFSAEELSHILEFTTKTRVLQYKGQIQEWIAEAESILALGYINVNDDFHNKSGIYLKKLGGQTGTDVILAVARWAKEADPAITLRISEDHVLEKSFPNAQPGLNSRLFTFLKRVKAESAPIDRLDIENNLWIYVSPSEQQMIDGLKQVQELGIALATPETTVITSKTYPIWFETPAPSQAVKDPLVAQAEVYNRILRAYLKVGANAFGFGDISDSYSWFKYFEKENGEKVNGMILDQNDQPKPAYYAIAQTLFDYITGKLA